MSQDNGYGKETLLEMDRVLEEAQHGNQKLGCLPSWRTVRRVLLLIALMMLFLAVSGGRGSFSGLQAGLLMLAATIFFFVAVRTFSPRR